MHAIAWFQQFNPKLFYLLTAGVVWVLIWAWRKVSIDSWNAVTRQNPLLQNLPSIVLSGLISAAPALNKGFVDALTDILYGAFAGGAMSVFSHHLLKESPLPYQGGGPAPKPTAPDPDPKLPAPGGGGGP